MLQESELPFFSPFSSVGGAKLLFHRQAYLSIGWLMVYSDGQQVSISVMCNKTIPVTVHCVRDTGSERVQKCRYLNNIK